MNSNSAEIPDKFIPYLAGLFDGEGSVILTRRFKYDRNRVKRKSFVVYVTISNTHKEVIDFVKNTFGGSVYSRERATTDKIRCNYRCWVWVASNLVAYKVLKALYPSLIIKKEEAREILEYIDRNFQKGRKARAFARHNSNMHEKLMNEIFVDAEETLVKIRSIKESSRERL